MPISFRLNWYQIIFIVIIAVILIGINLPYTTKEPYRIFENYTEKMPYKVTENYSEKQIYQEPIYHIYLWSEVPEDEIRYVFENVTSYSYNHTGKNVVGLDEYIYTVCQQIYCSNYSNITDASIKTNYVTKYKNIQKSRKVIKYRNFQKSREVNKTIYINLSLLQRILKDKNLTDETNWTRISDNGINYSISNSQKTPDTRAGVNQVVNPSFESGGTLPFNWSFVSSNGTTPIWDNVFHNGSKAVKISIPGTKDVISGYPKSDLIRAKAGTNYTLSAWVKTQGTGGTNAPAVRVVEIDANKKLLRQSNISFSKGTFNWTQKQINFQTLPNTTFFYIYANIRKGYGTFWVDDIELKIKTK